MRAALLLAAIAVALAGCGGHSGSAAKGGSPRMIDWDLSHSHTQADVHWSQPDRDAIDVQPDGAVRIRFPGGHEFSADGSVLRHVFVKRDDDTVSEIQVQTTPLTRDDAYRQALEWAQKWGTPREPLDRWHREFGDAGGRETPNALSTAPGKDLGPGGFGADVKILYSFDQQRPAVAALEFSWTGGGPAGT